MKRSNRKRCRPAMSQCGGLGVRDYGLRPPENVILPLIFGMEMAKERMETGR